MALSRTPISPEACSTSTPSLVEASRAGRGGGLLLSGGTANRGHVMRVGNTVVRPTAPFRQATHALLKHLDAVGFDGAPRVLAVGPATETLTYIAGRAAVPPFPGDMLTDEALISVADLLHRYHRAVSGFDPTGYTWPRPVPFRYRTGLVSHNDVYPANVVFRGGRAVALIDFDLAGPGSAVWDFAAAARLFVPLLDEADVTDSRCGRALERFRIFLGASGLPHAARIAVVDALLANHDWTYAIVTEAAAAGHASFADHWCAIAPSAGRARRWCARHLRALRAAASQVVVLELAKRPRVTRSTRPVPDTAPQIARDQSLIHVRDAQDAYRRCTAALVRHSQERDGGRGRTGLVWVENIWGLTPPCFRSGTHRPKGEA